MKSLFSRLWKRPARRPLASTRLQMQRLEDRDVPAVIFAVGSGEGAAPRVRVFNADLSPRFDFMAYDTSFTGGVHVATADVNGDGQADIITGAGVGGGPHVKVFDGNTGQLIKEFMAYDLNFRGGVWVAGGDIDRDGHAEVITGAGDGGGPHVKAFNLYNTVAGVPTDEVNGLARLRNFMAYDDQFRGGVRVAMGDVNADGYSDIVTGPGVGGGADVRVYDGKSGNMLFSRLIYDPTNRLGLYMNTGDIDGDGKAEIITGVGSGGSSNVMILDGATGTPKNGFERGFMAFGDGPNDTGVRVAAADLDGDGAAEIITGGGPGSASFRVYNSKDLASAQSTATAFDAPVPGGVFVG